MKKSVLYVGNFELPDGGASAHRVVNNGKIFRSLGYDVKFLGITRKESFTGIRPAEGQSDMYEESYPQGTAAWIKHIFDTKNIARALSECENPVLLILYNLPYETAKACKKEFGGKVRIAYDCTEWNDTAQGNALKQKYKALDCSQIITKLSGVLDGIIVISSEMEKNYADIPCVRIPPLVDLEDEKWKQERKSSDKKVICYAGSPGNKDCIDKIVFAFSMLARDDAVLRIVGVTEEEFTALCPELSFALSDVEFTGRLPHAEALSEVLSCDVYCFVREQNRRNNAGFPTKFAESYTAGVQIIASPVSDIRDYFTEDDGVLSESTAPEEIADAMNRLLDKEYTPALRDGFDFHAYTEKLGAWLDKIKVEDKG